MRSPDQESSEIHQIKSILNELKKKVDVYPIWVVFNADKIVKHEKETDEKIILFNEYSDAIEILDEFNPDLILTEVEFVSHSIVFTLGARFKKIPIVTYCFVEHFNVPFSITLKSRLRIFRKGGSLINNETNGDGNLLEKINLKKNFLKRTLQKIGYNKFRIWKFILFNYNTQLFSKTHGGISLHKFSNGELNLCSSELWKNELESAGFNESKIFVVGNPYLNKILSDVNTHNSKYTKSTKNIRILFCASPMHEHGWLTKVEHKKIITHTINRVLTNDNFEIALKIHPSSSSITEYQEILRSCQEHIKLYQKENILEVLDHYDIMITYGSSMVMMYGVLLKKPILFLDLHSKIKSLNIFYDKTISTLCMNIDEIIPKIIETDSRKIENASYENFIKKHFVVSNSSHNSAKKILELLKC
mgnify:CR=1 FL=1